MKGARVTSTARELLSPVSASVGPINQVSRRAIVASLTAITAMAVTGARRTHAQSSTPAPDGADGTPQGAGTTQLLPRDAILPVEAVERIIPEVTTETNTGPNVTVMGTPIANRAVTFSSADDAQHVVLSVDQYPTNDEAKRSFDKAFEASKRVPGVTTETVSGLGEAALIGVVTQGTETHVGGGALFGNLIVNATLQSFDGTDENKDKVAELISKQAAHAEKALGAATSATPAS
jgi:hypothetical protein